MVVFEGRNAIVAGRKDRHQWSRRTASGPEPKSSSRQQQGFLLSLE